MRCRPSVCSWTLSNAEFATGVLFFGVFFLSHHLTIHKDDIILVRMGESFMIPVVRGIWVLQVWKSIACYYRHRAPEPLRNGLPCQEAVDHYRKISHGVLQYPPGYCSIPSGAVLCFYAEFRLLKHDLTTLQILHFGGIKDMNTNFVLR